MPSHTPKERKKKMRKTTSHGSHALTGRQKRKLPETLKNAIHKKRS